VSKPFRWDIQVAVSDATLVSSDLSTSSRLARGSSHRASAYVLQIARELVEMGRRHFGRPAVMWMESWEVALRWQDERRYAILAYQSQNPMTQQMADQIADAFTRISRKKVVEFRQASPTTGFLFFGGAPPELKIATVEFPRIETLNDPNAPPQEHPWSESGE